MHAFSRFTLQASLALTLAQAANGSIVISILMNRLDDQTGNSIPAGALLQLIDLGPDGIFDGVDPLGTGRTGIDQWTTGNDRVLNLPFTTTFQSNPVAGDFASTAAFDLTYSGSNESTTGRSSRIFVIETGLTPGTKLGIRWFPGLKAADYYSGSGITLVGGEYYGQFTRQVSPAHDPSAQLWVSPADGFTVSFNPMVTADMASPPANPDPANFGDAMFWVPKVPLPEPANVGLSLIGAACIALFRRRTAKP